MSATLTLPTTVGSMIRYRSSGNYRVLGQDGLWAFIDAADPIIGNRLTPAEVAEYGRFEVVYEPGRRLS